MSLNAQELRKLPKDQLKETLSQLTPQQLDELRYTWEFWARPEQLEPKGDWNIWFLCQGRGAGKDLCQDTDILTKNKGWVKLKDIEVGDFVFAWDGTPTRVKEVYIPPKRALVEFTFSDGSTLVSSVEHEWVTWTHRDRKQYGRRERDKVVPDNWPNWSEEIKNTGRGTDSKVGPKVRTTQDIIDTFTHSKRGDLNHSIPMCLPIEGENVEEIKDAYYLGYWLGDGYSGSTHSIAVGDSDVPYFLSVWPQFERIDTCNYRAPWEDFAWVRELGLRNNKHFPECAYFASTEQRLSILQGLMDSDGCVDKSKVEFTSTKRSLAEGVVYLARSLGQKPVLSEGRATIYGRDCGPKYRVTWRPAYGVNPFRMPRKAAQVTFGGSQESRNHHRMIVDYKFVDWRPTMCISVEHPDHLFLAGEALIPTHNTRTGVEWVRSQVKKGKKRIAAIAATNSDIERVMVKGESGFLACCWSGDKTEKGVEIGYPEWSPTKRTLSWKNGAKVEFFSAEEPERLRGPQFDIAWTDELAAWNKDQETWDMLQFGLRLGKHPRVCVTTTPKSTALVRKLIKDPNTHVTTGSTFDNADNLASTYLQAVKDQYEGTRLGKQEIYAEVLTENEGALWTAEMIDNCQIDREEVPDLVRKVLAVDPALTNNTESDETGIILAGIDINGICYVLGDYTLKALPEVWGQKAAELFYEKECDRLVYETNQGRDTIPPLFKVVDENIPLKGVHASTAKIARAEPVSALYEQGKVKHVRNPEDPEASLAELETQLTTYEPMGRYKSPDRYDALVWSVTELMLKGFAKPKLKLVYSKSDVLK